MIILIIFERQNLDEPSQLNIICLKFVEMKACKIFPKRVEHSFYSSYFGFGNF